MKTRIIGAVIALVLAAVGAFVLITYVRGADMRAAAGAELTEVYIVAEAIPEGTAGDAIAEFVQVDTVPARNVAEGAVSDLADLEGLVASAEILSGEQLLQARFVDPAELAAEGEVPVPAGMQQVSFTLPADRVVGGEIRAGSRIGMVGTVDPAEPEGQPEVVNPLTQFVFNGVLVTRVQGVVLPDPESGDQVAEQNPSDGIMVTIALATHDVERWVWFTEGESGSYANMWLTLQGDETDTGGSSAVDLGNVWQ